MLDFALIAFLYLFVYRWIYLGFFVSEVFVKPQTDFFGLGETELNNYALFGWWILPFIYLVYVIYIAFIGRKHCRHFQKRLKHR